MLLLASWQISTPTIDETAIDWDSLFDLQAFVHAGSMGWHHTSGSRSGPSEATQSIDDDTDAGSDMFTAADRALLLPRADFHESPLLEDNSWSAILRLRPTGLFILRQARHAPVPLLKHAGERAPPCRA